MKPASLAVLGCAMLGLLGCATGGKFIEPRTDLDRKIFYVELDERGASYAISNDGARPGERTVTRMPMPAPVDVNSTIQILIEKAQLAGGPAAGPLATESDRLLKRKQDVAEVLRSLDGVVRARTRTLAAYERKDLDAFFKARAESDALEKQLRASLEQLWPRTDPETFAILVKAYDRPHFRTLQQFLSDEIAAIEAAHRRLESELRTRQRSLSLEAFVSSPGKQPAAIHVDGYDTIKAQDLERRDPLGLDLSPEERARLDAHVKSTRELAATLEQLRRGEIELEQAARRAIAETAPQIAELVERAERLYDERLGPQALKRRTARTDELFRAFLEAVESGNRAFFERKKADLGSEKEKLVADLPREVQQFQDALRDWIATGKDLRRQWQEGARERATPEAAVALINSTVRVARGFDALRKQLPDLARNAEARAATFVDGLVKELAEQEATVLLGSQAAGALKADLAGYAADLKQAGALIADVSTALGRLQHPVAELPGSTSATLDVPLDQIKDTFIDLLQTPRLVGDTITIRAALKDRDGEGKGKVHETSLATFRVERFGYYADLSPAVVLVKPRHIAGTDTGFRFAPTLSWMHHWNPRPGDTGTTASVFRALDPALGLHSAFTNFDSPTSDNSAQIGLGVTLAFWKNRLQFGAGRNLMAESRDEGRTYFFVGSDLIGLLQAFGIGKP